MIQFKGNVTVRVRAATPASLRKQANRAGGLHLGGRQRKAVQSGLGFKPLRIREV